MDPQNTNNPSGYNRELREDGCPVLPLPNKIHLLVNLI